MKKNITLPVLLVILVLCGCNKMDSTYRDFLKNGPIIYTERVDSVKVYPGRNRVLITWMKIKDPRVSQLKISWASGAGSKTVPIASAKDTSTLIEGLTEGNFVFQFSTADDAGNKSIQTDAVGVTYDTLYEKGLIVRDVNAITRKTTTLTLSFKSMLGVDAYSYQEVTYKSSGNNQMKTIQVPGDQSAVTITDFSGSSVTHRSVYRPQVLSPDLFYSSSTSVKVPD